jgi:hypothetical protein
MFLLLGRRIHSGGRGIVGSIASQTRSLSRCPVGDAAAHASSRNYCRASRVHFHPKIIAKQYQGCYAVSYLNLTDTPQFNSLQGDEKYN